MQIVLEHVQNEKRYKLDMTITIFYESNGIGNDKGFGCLVSFLVDV